MTGPVQGGGPVLSGFPLRLSDADIASLVVEVRRNYIRTQLMISIDNAAVQGPAAIVVLDEASVRTLVQALRHWLAGRMVDVPSLDDTESLGGAS